MLDEKDLQAIAQLLARQKNEIDQDMQSMKQEILDETAHRMNVLLETKVQTQLNLIVESQQIMMGKLDSKVDREESEDRITTLESVVRNHSREIAELKRAN